MIQKMSIFNLNLPISFLCLVMPLMLIPNYLLVIMSFSNLADSKCFMLFSSLKIIAPISLVLNDWI